MHQFPFTDTDMQWAHSLLPEVCQLTEAACAAMMLHFRQELKVLQKFGADGRAQGPVTAADHAADAVFMQGLADMTPDVPVISEELEIFPDVARAAAFWLIDPLDGTKSFVRGEESFCTCAALVIGKRPILGVIGWPVAGKFYAGVVGKGAHRQIFGGPPEAIQLREPGEPLDVLFSSRGISPEARAWLNGLSKPYRYTALSSAQKFCLLAEGSVDLYPRFIPTMEWDTAAGQAIVEAAGGQLIDWQGQPLHYGKPGWLNPGFIALGRTPVDGIANLLPA